MRWLILLVSVAGVLLVIYSTVAVQRQRTAAAGPSPWRWAVILSRLFLLPPFVALAASGGQWPGVPLLAAWFALTALFMLSADVADRFHLLRTLKARQKPPRLD
ncbi:MAG: hypothetical protein QME79_00040 [Bacillota bacterium]|nr:hypothetical protein [Bacillota bacterium]